MNKALFLRQTSLSPSSSDSIYTDQEQGSLPVSLPATVGSTGGGSAASGDVIAAQPVTVQLGAGFIVGCVVGVILYGMMKVGSRLVERRMVPRGAGRIRERGREMEVAVLVEV